MSLYTVCKSCKESISVKSSASTRPELQMEQGDDFSVNCQTCGKVDKIHVNDVKSEINKTTIFIGLILGVVITIVLWVVYGAIGTVSMIIPLLFWQQQMNSAKSFNSFMIRRK
jgi:hypothetical protein